VTTDGSFELYEAEEVWARLKRLI